EVATRSGESGFQTCGATAKRPSFDSCLPGADDFREDIVQTPRKAPTGIVAFDLAQVTDVADVVPLARLVGVLPLHLSAGNGLDPRECLENGARVFPSASEIVDLRTARRGEEFLDESGHVV